MPDNKEERRQRTLTQQDIEILATEIRKQMVSQFYSDLGHGVWGFVWKGLIVLGMGIAVYGAGKNHI